MSIPSLLKSRPALVILAGVIYVAGKSLTQYLGIDDSAVGLLADPMSLGNAGLMLIWGIGHCDSMDGPVVTQARKALEIGNVNLVLPWVRAEDEGEVRIVFDHAISVRKLGTEARELADTHFFETLVRIHRAGEGAPFTGLKPAGRDLGPPIRAGDKALEDGSIDRVVTLLIDVIRDGLHKRFHAAHHQRNFDRDNVRAGREFLEAYVGYIHYVEGLWKIASGVDHDHHERWWPAGVRIPASSR